MQQIRDISSTIEGKPEKTALSIPADESSRKSQILQQLVYLQLARKEAMGEKELRLYIRGLEPFSIAAVSRVVGRLCTTKRGEYEPKIPELGDLIDMVRAESRKENPIGDCAVCNNNRVVIIERDGRTVATDCECRREWRRRQGVPA